MDRHRGTFSEHRQARGLESLLRWGRVVGRPVAASWGPHMQPISGHCRLGGVAAQADALNTKLPAICPGAAACLAGTAGTGVSSCHGCGQPRGIGLVNATEGRRREAGLQGLGRLGLPAGGASVRPEDHCFSPGGPARRQACAGRCGQWLDPGRGREQDAALMPAPIGDERGVRDVLG